VRACCHALLDEGEVASCRKGAALQGHRGAVKPSHMHSVASTRLISRRSWHRSALEHAGLCVLFRSSLTA
jgi:hypothetical protein